MSLWLYDQYLVFLLQVEGAGQGLAGVRGAGQRVVLRDPGELQVHVVEEPEQSYRRLQLGPPPLQGALQGLKPA